MLHATLSELLTCAFVLHDMILKRRTCTTCTCGNVDVKRVAMLQNKGFNTL